MRTDPESRLTPTRLRSWLGCLLLGLLAATTSCSPGPSQSFLRQRFQGWLDTDWPGCCKVIEFRVLERTHEPGTDLGVGADGVTVKYYAKVEVVSDVTNRGFGKSGLHICAVGQIRFITPATMRCPDLGINLSQILNPDAYVGAHVIRKGYVFETTGTTVWTKTAKGWQ